MPDEIDKWAERLAADSVKAGEAEYGKRVPPWRSGYYGLSPIRLGYDVDVENGLFCFDIETERPPHLTVHESICRVEDNIVIGMLTRYSCDDPELVRITWHWEAVKGLFENHNPNGRHWIGMHY